MEDIIRQLSSISWQLKRIADQAEKQNQNYETVHGLRKETKREFTPQSFHLKRFLENLGKDID